MTLLAMIITGLVCSSIGLFAFRQKNNFAKYYLFSFSGFFFGLMISALLIGGIIPYTLEAYTTMILGATWEMIFFSLTLGYKIKLLYDKHAHAMSHIEAQNKILFLQSRYTSVGELIRNITHQWKEPLGEMGAIQTNLKTTLLMQGQISKEKLLNAFELSHKILRHLAETIDTFYNFFRKNPTQHTLFDISQEILAIETMVKYTFDTEQITLAYSIKEPILLVGNKNEFTHALLNIILNAKNALIRNKIENPSIFIHAMKQNHHAIITIEDNAGGIVDIPIDKIFDIGISSNDQSIGIGLFIAKTIIEEKMGGTIAVFNQSNGAKFTISIPLKSEYQISKKQHIIALNNSSSVRAQLPADLDNSFPWLLQIFDDMHWSIAVSDAVTNRFKYVNTAFLKLHGYNNKYELQNVPITQVVAHECLMNLQHRLEGIDEMSNNHHSFELIHIRKDGSRFLTNVEITNLKDDHDQIIYRVISVRNVIHDQKICSQFLFQEFALEHVKEAIFLVDKNGQFQYVNQEASHFLEYSIEELHRMCIGDIDIYWPNWRWSKYWNLLKKEKKLIFETKLRCKNGLERAVEITAHYFEHDGIGYNMFSSQDIQERKKISHYTSLLGKILNNEVLLQKQDYK